AVFEEVQGMARQRKGPFRLDLTPIVKTMGMEWVIQQLGAKQVIQQLGAKQVIQQLGAKQVIQQLGLKQVIDEAGGGEKDVGGVKQLWGDLPPEQRRQLKRLAQE